MSLSIKYVFLGIIQGLTEFFPVSSSAHLVIFQDLFGVEKNQILLDIALHLGTSLAVVVFLFQDIRRLLSSPSDNLFRAADYKRLISVKKFLFLIFLATAITGVVVISGKEFFESMFLSARDVVFPLLLIGLILLCTKKFTKGERKLSDLEIGDALWFGIVQGLAVIPGISRSGITISTLLFRNVERETAFKFSFLASILAILGALFFKLEAFSQVGLFEIGYMGFGFLASFLSGLFALKILLSVIRKARLHLFGYYCLVLAGILLLIR